MPRFISLIGAPYLAGKLEKNISSIIFVYNLGDIRRIECGFAKIRSNHSITGFQDFSNITTKSSWLIQTGLLALLELNVILISYRLLGENVPFLMFAKSNSCTSNTVYSCSTNATCKF